MNVIIMNGIKLKTNKNQVSTSGSSGVFAFGDGSSYDHMTGVFINKGPGYVEVNGVLLQEGDNSKRRSSWLARLFGK